jgi:hypothetical protein
MAAAWSERLGSCGMRAQIFFPSFRSWRVFFLTISTFGRFPQDSDALRFSTGHFLAKHFPWSVFR